ncbi:MAG TPA: phosphatase PAP2 family protein [Actinotalea sp.]|nr:phosphatase PAP2 family protein [Actinotalea sp.]
MPPPTDPSPDDPPDHGPGVRRNRARENLVVAVGLVLVVLGVAGFLGVLDAVHEVDDLALLDEPVLALLVALRSPGTTTVLTAVTTLAGPVVLPVLVLVGSLVWGRRRGTWWQASLLAGSVVAASLVSVTLKEVVARPRPPADTMVVPGLEATYSFPSGHTIGAATFLLVLGYLLWMRRPTLRSFVGWLSVVVLGVGLVALSRLYLGYHFVTDVVASMALAVAVLGVVVVLDRRRETRALSRVIDGS